MKRRRAMEKEILINRLSIILTKDELKRLTLNQNKNGIELIADVHGMKCFQAKRFINNILNLSNQKMKLTVIHGFHHGTAIKDMIKNGLENRHIINIYNDQKNIGRTFIIAA